MSCFRILCVSFEEMNCYLEGGKVYTVTFTVFVADVIVLYCEQSQASHGGQETKDTACGYTLCRWLLP